MAVEMLNWFEIPVQDMARAKSFYEQVFEFQIVDMKLGEETYGCFPNKNGEGFSGALAQYPFIQPGKTGPLIYLNSYGDINGILERVKSAGGRVIETKKEIASGFGYFAFFEDSEGNLLALQGEN